MRTRAEVRRLRTALEIIEGCSSHKEAVLIARVALEPTTAALYHGPTLRSKVRALARRGFRADVIMSRPIEANPADTPIEAPPAMRPDSPAAP